MPKSFILKTTHDSGGFIRVEDKENFDYEKAEHKLNKALRRNYFYYNREWAYKNIKPRILAEKMEESLGKPDSIEYKVFCQSGEVKFFTIYRNQNR